MARGEEPQEATGGLPAPAGQRLRSSQRIALGTLTRSGGEAVGKVASLVLFVAIARGLGEQQFGDFVFGLSLSTVLLTGAGLGMQELIAREVASDNRSVDALLWNVVVLKGLMLAALLVVIGAIVSIQGYSVETRVAILIVSVGIGFEYQANTFYAVLQGFERQHHIATALIVNRIATTVMCIVVLLLGGGLVPVSIFFSLGSALGLVTAYWLMRRYVVRPNREVDRRNWPALMRSSIPLGMFTILAILSLRSSVVLLGFLSPTGGADVGQYGAAFRLVEAMIFVPSALSAALLPWFSRSSDAGSARVARGFEISLKAVIAITAPIALALALFAQPLITTLYGSDYAAAVTPLRVLAALVILIGINGVVTAVLIGRKRPRAYTAPAVTAIVLTIILGLVLIPRFGANGAAATAIATAAVLAMLTIRATTREFASISARRVIVPPLLAGIAMAGVAVALSVAPWVPVAIVSIAVYAIIFLGVERLFFPGDFAFYSSVARLRRADIPSR